MNSIKANIRDKSKTKKGFILVETILIVSLVGVLVSMEIIALSRYMKTHILEIRESRESFYVNEAMSLIEHQVNDAEYVDVSENRIKLKRFKGVGYDYIRKDKQSDIIISYGSVYSSTTNNILKNTSDFKVERIGQVLYISIEMEEGKVYRRCLGLERVKVKGIS